MMTKTAIALIFLALAAAGCSSVARGSSEAAWRRGQCEQIVDQKLREKCMEQVESDFGRW